VFGGDHRQFLSMMVGEFFKRLKDVAVSHQNFADRSDAQSD
jgi:hypothetical protein